MLDFLIMVLGFFVRSIGLRTDTSSQTGSLHAKIVELRASLVNVYDVLLSSLQKPRGLISTASYQKSGGSSWATALDITGKGALNYVGFNIDSVSSSAESFQCRVTLDGESTTMSGSFYESGDTGPAVIRGNLSIAPGADCNFGTPFLPPMSFRTSLKIEVYTGQYITATTFYGYEKEA